MQESKEFKLDDDKLTTHEQQRRITIPDKKDEHLKHAAASGDLARTAMNQLTNKYLEEERLLEEIEQHLDDKSKKKYVKHMRDNLKSVRKLQKYYLAEIATHTKAAAKHQRNAERPSK